MKIAIKGEIIQSKSGSSEFVEITNGGKRLGNPHLHKLSLGIVGKF